MNDYTEKTDLEEVSLHDMLEELKRRIKLGFGVENDIIKALELKVNETTVEADEKEIEDFEDWEIVSELAYRCAYDYKLELDVIDELNIDIGFKPDSLEEQMKFDLYLQHQDNVTLDQLEEFFTGRLVKNQ